MKWVYPLFIELNRNGKGSFVAGSDYSSRIVRTYTPNGEDVAVKLGKVTGKVTKSMISADDSMDGDDLGLPVRSIVSSKCLDDFR